jgi:hypothetical protein
LCTRWVCVCDVSARGTGESLKNEGWPTSLRGWGHQGARPHHFVEGCELGVFMLPVKQSSNRGRPSRSRRVPPPRSWAVGKWFVSVRRVELPRFVSAGPLERHPAPHPSRSLGSWRNGRSGTTQDDACCPVPGTPCAATVYGGFGTGWVSLKIICTASKLLGLWCTWIRGD